MAKIGSITISQGTYSIPNNTTPLVITGKITTTGESYRGSHRTGTITVTQDGKVIHSSAFTSGAPANSTTTLFSIPLTVCHYSNGSSGTIAVSYNYDSGWCSASTSKVLTTIPRYATITSAPDFTDEDNPTIKYSNPAGSVVTSLQACISLTGSSADVPYRDIPINGTSYQFVLTDAERKTLRLATTGGNSRTVMFYVRTVLAGVTNYDTESKIFKVINNTPTLSPTVEDVNENTIALTGDKSILVRNFSNAHVESEAQVYKDTTIKSQKVICGSKSINTGSGIIEQIGSGAFVFSVTDNRNNTVSKTVNVPFIEYVNLTCNLNASPPDAEGDMTFSIYGNYFAGSFGTVDNTIKVYYRYKVNNEEYGDWIEVSDIIADSNENTYTVNISINGLNYKNKYTFQTIASDELMEIQSVEKTVKTVPVFDWGEHDFNFNVPVTMNGVAIEKYVSQMNFGFITGYIPEAVTVASYGTIPFAARNSSGSYFSLEKGIVTVGKDVACVRVSAVIGGSAKNGRCWAHLRHNDTTLVDAIQYGEFFSPHIVDILPVNEGDTISVYVIEEFTARSGGVDCYICVERLK